MNDDVLLNLTFGIQLLLGFAVLAWCVSKFADLYRGKRRRSPVREPEGLSPHEIVEATGRLRESRIERGKIADEELA